MTDSPGASRPPSPTPEFLPDDAIEKLRKMSKRNYIREDPTKPPTPFVEMINDVAHLIREEMFKDKIKKLEAEVKALRSVASIRSDWDKMTKKVLELRSKGVDIDQLNYEDDLDLEFLDDEKE